MNNIIMRLENIQKFYKGQVDQLNILRNLNLSINKGEFIAILGRSGSGKSTLLNIMGLLDRANSGKIYFDDKEIKLYNDREIDRIKNKFLGFVFQFNYLLSEFTALENVMLPALVENYNKKIDIENKAKELLSSMELSERFYHKPNQLSGGEKQRVAIARALINSPQIILADEPTGNLDEETSDNIFGLFKMINKDFNQTLVVVTHSRDLANMADRRYYLKKGILEEKTETIDNFR
ncbi:MAG: ABC transporter ATP-binding protein [Fusobacteriaceae bacterium]|jgi:lipoprotein-releasing system ATP-binding protein|nr:ABC transporter ATP-binding protein [Fusobacteriaceae bacterium]